jgi:hypothetical protein
MYDPDNRFSPKKFEENMNLICKWLVVCEIGVLEKVSCSPIIIRRNCILESMARANLREQKTTRARGEFYILLVCVCKCINDYFPSKLPGRRAWHRVHWHRVMMQ